MDVIASSAFSTKIDSHNDPDNQFVKHARRLFARDFNWKLVLAGKHKLFEVLSYFSFLCFILFTVMNSEGRRLYFLRVFCMCTHNVQKKNLHNA